MIIEYRLPITDGWFIKGWRTYTTFATTKEDAESIRRKVLKAGGEIISGW